MLYMPSKRPHRVPPPLTRGLESFEGETILQEVPGETALPLWKSLRAVYVAASAPGRSSDLFSRGALRRRTEVLSTAFVPRNVKAALEELATLLTRSWEPSGVSHACEAVADWAQGQGFVQTALEFAQAAAILTPGDARPACSVGRLARATRQYHRAESWYRYAAATARELGDWTSYTQAWVGMGSVHIAKGNYPAARNALTRGLRSAKRHSLPFWVAAAHHELLTVAIHTRQTREVAKHGLAALTAYGAGHPRIPALAHDIAAFWMVKGFAAEALEVFKALPPDEGLLDRLASAACMARAAGGAKKPGDFRAACKAATRLLRDPRADERAASAWLDIAYGAFSLDDHRLAAEAARNARDSAAKFGENAIEQKAGALLEQILAEKISPEAPSAVRRAPAPVQALSTSLVNAITAGSSL
jgi:tetratricopeptide (TPR) repeat protein